MDKKQYKKEIRLVEKEIEKLERKKDKLLKDMSKNCDLSLKEKLANVLEYGEEKTYTLNTNNILVKDYYSRCDRHETIEVSDMIQIIMENNMCDNLKDQNEVNVLFGYSKIDQTTFDHDVEVTDDLVDLETFIELAEDLVKENIKTFTYDW